MRNMRIAACKPAAALILVLACAPATRSVAATQPNAEPARLPAKSSFHLYLLLGQSNMAGRGKIETEGQKPHPRMFMLDTNGIWQPAVEPVTRDKPGMLGVGPALSFGKAMAEKRPGVTIGLVPCALGGTPLQRWEKGGDLYSNAVHRAKLAAQAGTLRGVHWHQGESDSKPGLAESYGARLARMIRDLRADLATPDLPFVGGQLGDFLFTRKTNNVPEAITVNEAGTRLPETVAHTGFIRVAGLGHKGDQLHFDSPAQREMGRRYAAEMMRLTATSTQP